MIDRNVRGEEYLGELCSKYCGLYTHMDCDGCKNNNKYTRAILQESDDLLKVDLYTLEEEHQTLEETWNDHDIKRAVGRVLLASGLEITEGEELDHICTMIEDCAMRLIIDNIDGFYNVVAKEKNYYDCRLCSVRATKDMCKNCEAECNFRKADNKNIEDKAHQFENDCYESANRQKNKFSSGYGTMLNGLGADE